MPKQQDLRALRNLIAEAEQIVESTPMPEGRTERAAELLRAAMKLADALMETPPAAALGRKGGLSTAKRGSDYFRKIAAMREKRGGGRPRKNK